jgi:hypothetical protein
VRGEEERAWKSKDRDVEEEGEEEATTYKICHKGNLL